MIYLACLLIGVVAGLRAFMAPAAVSWAASLGGVDLSNSWLAFLGYRWTPWIISVLAVVELVTDQLPSTPSRKVPPQFGARVVMGAVSGAAIATPSGSWGIGALVGVLGAVAGTFGGAAARAGMATKFGKDRPAALIEDLAAIVAAGAVVGLMP